MSLVQRAVEAARELTGMELAYVGEFTDGNEVYRAVAGDAEQFGVRTGLTQPLEATYCQRMVDGRIGEVVPDTAAAPGAQDLPAEAPGAARSYLGVPVRLPDGELYGVLCAISATARPELGDREAETLRMLAHVVAGQVARDRETAAEDRARNELLASVSHDLRGPLLAVVNLAEDLGEGIVEPTEAARAIESETRRVLRLVDDMVVAAGERTGELPLRRREVDLLDVARRAHKTARGIAGDRAAEVVLDVPERPLLAEADPARLHQALVNLLENALKYSPGGGEVRLTLMRDRTTAIFEVIDHGIGLSRADAGHIGERFFRAPSALDHEIDGTGLGLASVASIAALHEGTLTVASTPDEGSRFSLRIPLARRD